MWTLLRAHIRAAVNAMANYAIENRLISSCISSHPSFLLCKLSYTKWIIVFGVISDRSPLQNFPDWVKSNEFSIRSVRAKRLVGVTFFLLNLLESNAIITSLHLKMLVSKMKAKCLQRISNASPFFDSQLVPLQRASDYFAYRFPYSFLGMKYACVHCYMLVSGHFPSTHSVCVQRS